MAAKADQNIKKKPRFPHLSLKTAVTMVVMKARTYARKNSQFRRDFHRWDQAKYARGVLRRRD